MHFSVQKRFELFLCENIMIKLFLSKQDTWGDSQWQEKTLYDKVLGRGGGNVPKYI